MPVTWHHTWYCIHTLRHSPHSWSRLCSPRLRTAHKISRTPNSRSSPTTTSACRLIGRSCHCRARQERGRSQSHFSFCSASSWRRGFGACSSFLAAWGRKDPFKLHVVMEELQWPILQLSNEAMDLFSSNGERLACLCHWLGLKSAVYLWPFVDSQLAYLMQSIKIEPFNLQTVALCFQYLTAWLH